MSDLTELKGALGAVHGVLDRRSLFESADCVLAAISALEAQEARIAELQTFLSEAADEIEAWGAYAAEYFQEKHDLAGVVSEFRAKALTPSLPK